MRLFNVNGKQDSGDSPEVGERSFAALRMTKSLSVILSAAKDLWGAFVQQPCLSGLADFWGITRSRIECNVVDFDKVRTAF